MKHTDTIDYPGGMKKLAEDIGDLKYDSLKAFLIFLSQKIESDAKKDFERGRPKLSSSLTGASDAILLASKHIAQSWKISKPYMK